MEWICTLFESQDQLQPVLTDPVTSGITNLVNKSSLGLTTISPPYGIAKEPLTTTETSVQLEDESWGFTDWNNKLLVPLLCCFGIIGNLLNLVILGKKIREGVDTMEKGALIGMMSLAGSDLLFCVATLSGTYLPGAKLVYHRRDFVYFYTLYGNCIQNILIKTSTWFTVIMAVSRYFVVSQPIRARQYMRCGHTALAILLCLVAWITLNIPLAFLWKPIQVNCRTGDVYILEVGTFSDNTTMKLSFTYIWAILGFFIPVAILGYCNMKLIYSLHISRNFRLQGEVDSVSSQNAIHGHSLLRAKNSVSVKHNADKSQRGITCTLVAIVIMFFVCVCPSEIIQLYEDIQKPDYHSSFRYALISANLLQAVNFSANFALYCVANAYFRKTMKDWLMWCFSKERRLVRSSSRSKGSRMSTGSVTTKKVTIVTENEGNEGSCTFITPKPTDSTSSSKEIF